MKFFILRQTGISFLVATWAAFFLLNLAGVSAAVVTTAVSSDVKSDLVVTTVIGTVFMSGRIKKKAIVIRENNTPDVLGLFCYHLLVIYSLYLELRQREDLVRRLRAIRDRKRIRKVQPIYSISGVMPPVE